MRSDNTRTEKYLLKNSGFPIKYSGHSHSSGGSVVAVGTPEEVAKYKRSHTGRFLRSTLNGHA
jgi:excinuclease ABC subunit A